MNFLAAVLGLTLLYWPRLFAFVQVDRWFEHWQESVASIPAVKENVVASMAVVLGLPTLGIILILDLLADAGLGLAYFAVNVLTLLYAFGRGDSRDQVNMLATDLDRDDLQAAYHDLTAFSASASEGESIDTDSFIEEVKGRLAYSYLERYLAVIFWFLLAGAPMAFLYRLTILYQQNNLANGATLHAGKWLWLLEWLPLRVAGLTLALVGHFEPCLRNWRDLLWSQQSSQQILLQLVNGALSAPSQASNEEYDLTAGVGLHLSPVVRQIEQLFFYVMALWLVSIALVIILT